MKIAVVIETKDRRLAGGTNYLRETLTNLERGGAFEAKELHSLQIVGGGEQFDYFASQVPVHIAERRNVQVIGCPREGCTRQQNAMRAIRAGAMTDADVVLKLEDDVDVCADFLGSVARFVGEFGYGAAMCSLAATWDTVSNSRFLEGEETIFDHVLVSGSASESFQYVRRALANGQRVLAHAARGFWGAQALAFARPWAANLVGFLGPDPFLFDGVMEHRERGHDLLLQVWLQSVGARAIPVPVPSLVQHIGRQSNLNQPEIGHVQPFFQFPFGGRDFIYA